MDCSRCSWSESASLTFEKSGAAVMSDCPSTGVWGWVIRIVPLVLRVDDVETMTGEVDEDIYLFECGGFVETEVYRSLFFFLYSSRTSLEFPKSDAVCHVRLESG